MTISSCTTYAYESWWQLFYITQNICKFIVVVDLHILLVLVVHLKCLPSTIWTLHFILHTELQMFQKNRTMNSPFLSLSLFNLPSRIFLCMPRIVETKQVASPHYCLIFGCVALSHIPRI